MPQRHRLSGNSYGVNVTSMLTVHHLNNSRSQRVLWLLEELGVPYEIKSYQRDAATMLAPPELRAVHPLGKSPVVTEGDVTVAETGAIVEWVIERYGQGKLAPSPGSAERLRWTYWLHYSEGSAMPRSCSSWCSAACRPAPLPCCAPWSTSSPARPSRASSTLT